MADSNADHDDGFSGREVQEGNYSGAYGRGSDVTPAPGGRGLM